MTISAAAPAKKQPSKKAIAAGAILVVAALVVVGGGNKGGSATPGDTISNATQVPTETATTPPVAATAAGIAATLNSPYAIEGVTITIKKVGTSNGSQFLKPAAGNIYIGYLVNIAATDDNRFVNIADWTALSDGTKQGQWTFAGPDSWKPALGIAEIRNGASVEGWIAFEVPKPSAFVRLVYDPSFFSGEAKLTFDATVK